MSSALSLFPKSMQSLNETTPEYDMTCRPNLYKYVLCRVLERDLGTIEMGGAVVELHKDDIFVLRYHVIRDFVRDNKIELL